MGFKTARATIVSCLPCIDATLNASEHYMCTIMEDDADMMDATETEHELMPLIIACMPSLESLIQETEHQIVHLDYPCPEVTCFGSLHKEHWSAISCTDDKGVHRIRSLSGDELVETFTIPSNMRNAYL
jgi:hypothetical protein